MKKILLVAPANIEVCPYAKKYLDLFEKMEDVLVDIISWNRYDIKASFQKANYACIANSFLYEKESKVSLNPLRKINHFISFSKFIVRTYMNGSYDKLILLTSSTILFLPKRFLKKTDYIFDYRDTSYEWFFPFKLFVNRAIKFSNATFISSEGFKKILPKKYTYHIIHNIDSAKFVISSNPPVVNESKQIPIVVSFVGLFTEKKHMLKIIDFFAKDKRFVLKLWGYSENESDELAFEKHIKMKKIDNVFLLGKFAPKDKPGIFSKTDFLIYYYSSKFRYRFATANKYYDALLYSTPFIVNFRTTIGKKITRDGLGVSVNISSKNKSERDRIINYFFENNTNVFFLKRMQLMSKIIEEDNASNVLIEKFVHGE